MMKPIKLEDLKSKPHPLKAECKRYGITNDMLKNLLGLNYTYVNNMMGGVYPLPEKHEQKIKELLSSLEEQKRA